MLFIYLLSLSAVLRYVESESTTKQPVVEYFSEGFIRFFASSLNKKPRELEQLLKPAMDIARRMDESGQLSGLGEFGRTWFHIFFLRLHYNSYNDTIIYMRELKSFMENRRERCSAELNDIIDATNAIFSKADGEKINALIDEYEQFPNVNKTGELLCQELIDAFLKPILIKKTIKVINLVQHIEHRIDELDEGVQCDASFKKRTIIGTKPNSTHVEGYLIQAYLRFLEIVMHKHEYPLRQVFKYATAIVGIKRDYGHFASLSSFRYSIPRIISYYFRFRRIEVIKGEIRRRFYNTMKYRKITFDKDINDLIDFGNKFITEEQKDELFEVLEDFDKFPDSKRDELQICRDLINGFSAPFTENKNHLDIEVFTDELRAILRREYPDEKYAPFFSLVAPAENEIDQLLVDL